MTRSYAAERSLPIELLKQQFAPWREDAAVKAWRAVQSITPEIARQEPQAIAEMIAHLRMVQSEQESHNAA